MRSPSAVLWQVYPTNDTRFMALHSAKSLNHARAPRHPAAIAQLSIFSASSFAFRRGTIVLGVRTSYTAPVFRCIRLCLLVDVPQTTQGTATTVRTTACDTWLQAGLMQTVRGQIETRVCCDLHVFASLVFIQIHNPPLALHATTHVVYKVMQTAGSQEKPKIITSKMISTARCRSAAEFFLFCPRSQSLDNTTNQLSKPPSEGGLLLHAQHH